MNPRRGYHSSQQKNIVRSLYDFKLLQYFSSTYETKLKYFGLPGAHALDIANWENLISHVSAVERDKNNLIELEKTLELQFPHVGAVTHLGDLDSIILQNEGKRRTIGGKLYQPRVGEMNPGEHTVAWDFDIVYLDYFGTFVPAKGPSPSTTMKRRADAFGRLFSPDRQDSRKPWLLLITVEANLSRPLEKATIRHMLEEECEEASDQIAKSLKFVLSLDESSEIGAALFVHSSAAAMMSRMARTANLNVFPRGTVLYKGSSDRPMIHMAYEFVPAKLPLYAKSSMLNLLLSPIIQPNVIDNPGPAFALAEQQPLGQTKASVCAAIGFLGDSLESRPD